MKIDISATEERFRNGIRETAEELGLEIGEGIKLIAVKNDRFYVKCEEDRAEIGYSRDVEFFKGLFSVSKGLNYAPVKRCVKELGVMLDCSRNAVMRPQVVKKLIRKLAYMGYTYLELYTEDTYEVDGEPYFGYMRGRYTKAELKELDTYACGFGVELVPCIQTLAHLDALLLWKDYMQIFDTDDILMVGEPRTYELIDHIFKTVSETFTSRNVNIGMDEAHLVGLGKYLDKHGYRNRFDILKEHLEKVCEIAKKYGMKPAMWSDMFFRLAFQGAYYPKAGEEVMPAEVVACIPKGMKLIYWDYYHDDENDYDRLMKLHNQTGAETIYAGGAWSWTGITPRNAVSVRRMDVAVNACVKNHIDNVLITVWGNDGGECSCFSMLPTFCSVAEKVYANRKSMAGVFYALTGTKFSDFMKLDYANEVADNMSGIENPSKYMLYNDFFYGLLDSTICGREVGLYKKYVRNLKPLTQSGEYAYLFRPQYYLCKILAFKFDIATRTKTVYDNKDKEAAKRILTYDYKNIAKSLKNFKHEFEAQWLHDNKPFGWEVLQGRIDTMLGRLQYCSDKLLKWVQGGIDSIEELEEDKLDYRCYESEVKKHLYLLGFEKAFTASKLSLFVHRT